MIVFVTSCMECPLSAISEYGFFCQHPKCEEEIINELAVLPNCPLKPEYLAIKFDNTHENPASTNS